MPTTPTFATPTTYSADIKAGSVSLADVNGDGLLDAITANTVLSFQSGSSNNVSVYSGNGNGTFNAPVNYNAGSSPYALAVVDVNGDGKRDIITANFAGSNVSVLINAGNGTFNAAVNYAAGSQPLGVAVADINADGKLDLVVSNYAANTLSILTGNGNGTFNAASTISDPGGPRGVVVADVNRDGIPDIVTADFNSSKVSVLTGTGNGTFNAPVNYNLSFGGWGLAVADLNYDGILDIITTNTNSNKRAIAVLMGKADGTFQSEVTYDIGFNPISVVIADMNGDGVPDVITQAYGSNNVDVLIGNGDGTFVTPKFGFNDGTHPSAVAVGDVNSDGKPDIVAVAFNAAGTQNFLSVRLNTTPFPIAPNTDVAVAPDPNGNGNLITLNNPAALNASLGTSGVDTVKFTGTAPIILPDTIENLVLDGAGGQQSIKGNAGDNVVTVLNGSWNIDMGGGNNTVVLPDNFSSYTISFNGAGYQFINPATGATIQISNDQNLVFADSTFRFDNSANARTVFGLFNFALGRLPDPSGEGFLVTQLAKGGSLDSLAALFTSSPEFISQYGSNLTDAQYVSALYQNGYHRAPDAAGLAFWTAALRSEGRGQLMVDFATGFEEQNYVNALVGIGQGVLMATGPF